MFSLLYIVSVLSFSHVCFILFLLAMLFRDWSTSYLAAGSLWPAGVSAAVFDVKKDLVIPDDQIYNCAYDTVNIFSQSIRSTTTVTRLPVCPASQTETVTQTVTITAPSQSIDNANEDMIIPAKTGSSSPDLPWYSMIPAYFNQYTDADSQHPEDTAIDTILAPEYLDQDTDADTQFPDTAIDAIMAPAEPNVNYSRYPCPLSLAIDYTLKSDNSSWQLFCNTDLYYHDLRAHNATNLAVCMQECIKLNKLVASNPRAYGTQYCIAVTYTTWAAGLNANCYLKHAVTTAIYQAYKFDSAKLASFDLPNALAVSVYSNRPTATVPPPATSIPPAPYQPASPCPVCLSFPLSPMSIKAYYPSTQTNPTTNSPTAQTRA